MQDDILQACKIAVYGLHRFWKLHWKVIMFSVTIGIIAGIIVAKITQGNKKKSPWGWIIGGITVAGLLAYGVSKKKPPELESGK